MFVGMNRLVAADGKPDEMREAFPELPRRVEPVPGQALNPFDPTAA
jgi:hypothetical protein